MNALALTFDDGPDPVWTPQVLDALADRGAHATFFVIAPAAEAHPRLIERILAEGHRVELHCDRHVRHRTRSSHWVSEDTDRALARLQRLGVRPRLWRPPWGDFAPWTEEIARVHGLQLVKWTADTHDWRGDTAEQMLNAIGGELVAGAIVLAHDGLGPGAMRDDCRETVRFVGLAAEHIVDHGLTIAPVDPSALLHPLTAA